MRRIVLAAVVVGVGVSAWRVHAVGLPGYVRAWQAWSEGNPTGGLTLWGQRVLWWGRVGKLLQFAAGLAVVLDLVGTESLRAVGDRASGRWKHYRERLRVVRIFRVWRMGRQIFWSLYDKHTVYDGRGSAFSDFTLRHAPKPLDKPLPHIDSETLAGFQEDLLGTLREGHHKTPRANWTMSHPIIFAFLQERMPTHLRVSPTVMRTWTRWHNRVGVPVVGVLLFSMPALFISGIWLQVGNYLFGKDWGWLGATVLFIMIVFSWPVFEYVVFVMLTLFWLPLAAGVKLLVVLLDRQRPGHALRWIALALFIVGFHFDLLAS